MSLPDATLRARGRWPPPEGPRAAIVGSRRPSPYGEAVAEQLGLELARAGVVVISGLALGIDAAAHRGALNAGGVTVAVMGTGVDVIYPSAHSVLAALHVGGEVLDDPLAAPAGLRIKLAAERDGILSHLSDVLPMNASEIARKLQLPIAEVIGRLTSLELEGAVKRHQGGYVR